MQSRHHARPRSQFVVGSETNSIKINLTLTSSQPVETHPRLRHGESIDAVSRATSPVVSSVVWAPRSEACAADLHLKTTKTDEFLGVPRTLFRARFQFWFFGHSGTRGDEAGSRRLGRLRRRSYRGHGYGGRVRYYVGGYLNALPVPEPRASRLLNCCDDVKCTAGRRGNATRRVRPVSKVLRRSNRVARTRDRNQTHAVVDATQRKWRRPGSRGRVRNTRRRERHRWYISVSPIVFSFFAEFLFRSSFVFQVFVALSSSARR